ARDRDKVAGVDIEVHVVEDGERMPSTRHAHDEVTDDDDHSTHTTLAVMGPFRRAEAIAVLIVTFLVASPSIVTLGVDFGVARGVARGAPAGAMGDGVIVAFGDSLTAGLGVAPDEAYPARLEERLRREGYPYRVVNAGVSG